ncbi:MAG: nicotinate-nucleotide adenylyltransferase [Synergistaceae bacterium]|jgi:nicotinate-nucleotide adenylyltransferase|nr:nicotinate-nucleotide adenylyltransferase [Synergistaceae bacterium]
MPNDKIGVMGGTFDPIHNGHLFAADQASRALSLDRVIFVPSRIPPHKSYPLMASAADRYGMTELAIRNNPRFEISRIEMERTGPSYTAETLERFKAECAGALLFLITGIDAALDIPNWYEPQKILSLCKVAVVARPGYIRDKISELDDIVRDSLIILDTDMIDISATDIRNRVSSGGSVRYMTPDSVCDYIAKNNLYSGTGE